MAEGMKVNDVQSREQQLVTIALGSIAAYLVGEAAKYSDPSERDYRDGIRYAASVIEQIASGRLKVGAQ